MSVNLQYSKMNIKSTSTLIQYIFKFLQSIVGPYKLNDYTYEQPFYHICKAVTDDAVIGYTSYTPGLQSGILAPGSSSTSSPVVFP